MKKLAYFSEKGEEKKKDFLPKERVPYTFPPISPSPLTLSNPEKKNRALIQRNQIF